MALPVAIFLALTLTDFVRGGVHGDVLASGSTMAAGVHRQEGLGTQQLIHKFVGSVGIRNIVQKINV